MIIGMKYRHRKLPDEYVEEDGGELEEVTAPEMPCDTDEDTQGN
jgi:hypothetical protein